MAEYRLATFAHDLDDSKWESFVQKDGVTMDDDEIVRELDDLQEAFNQAYKELNIWRGEAACQKQLREQAVEAARWLLERVPSYAVQVEAKVTWDFLKGPEDED